MEEDGPEGSPVPEGHSAGKRGPRDRVLKSALALVKSQTKATSKRGHSSSHQRFVEEELEEGDEEDLDSPSGARRRASTVRGQRPAVATPPAEGTRKNAPRGEWTAAEEVVLAHKHMMLGNRWTSISHFLPLRSDNDVKNIWHSTLRSKNAERRSFLRTYARAVRDCSNDTEARRQAYDMATKVCGPPQPIDAALAAVQQQYQQHLAAVGAQGPPGQDDILEGGQSPERAEGSEHTDSAREGGGGGVSVGGGMEPGAAGSGGAHPIDDTAAGGSGHSAGAGGRLSPVLRPPTQMPMRPASPLPQGLDPSASASVSQGGGASSGLHPFQSLGPLGQADGGHRSRPQSLQQGHLLTAEEASLGGAPRGPGGEVDSSCLARFSALHLADQRQRQQLSGQHPHLSLSGQHPQLALSAQQAQLALSGQHPQLALSGQNPQLALSGQHPQLRLSQPHPQLGDATGPASGSQARGMLQGGASSAAANIMSSLFGGGAPAGGQRPGSGTGNQGSPLNLSGSGVGMVMGSRAGQDGPNSIMMGIADSGPLGSAVDLDDLLALGLDLTPEELSLLASGGDTGMAAAAAEAAAGGEGAQGQQGQGQQQGGGALAAETAMGMSRAQQQNASHRFVVSAGSPGNPTASGSGTGDGNVAASPHASTGGMRDSSGANPLQVLDPFESMMAELESSQQRPPQTQHQHQQQSQHQQSQQQQQQQLSAQTTAQQIQALQQQMAAQVQAQQAQQRAQQQAAMQHQHAMQALQAQHAQQLVGSGGGYRLSPSALEFASAASAGGNARASSTSAAFELLSGPASGPQQQLLASARLQSQLSLPGQAAQGPGQGSVQGGGLTLMGSGPPGGLRSTSMTTHMSPLGMGALGGMQAGGAQGLAALRQQAGGWRASAGVIPGGWVGPGGLQQSAGGGLPGGGAGGGANSGMRTLSSPAPFLAEAAAAAAAMGGAENVFGAAAAGVAARLNSPALGGFGGMLGGGAGAGGAGGGAVPGGAGSGASLPPELLPMSFGEPSAVDVVTMGLDSGVLLDCMEVEAQGLPPGSTPPGDEGQGGGPEDLEISLRLPTVSTQMPLPPGAMGQQGGGVGPGPASGPTGFLPGGPGLQARPGSGAGWGGSMPPNGSGRIGPMLRL
ncbi:hypothetical protein HYH03_010513 [Edaphochlamys debaryana]|uniref:Uncharacterized protein n=1 Tax=Edaphochlamys debaryana TaxID=47281 RepID=A0A836BXC2_9CHLO|nr:hypothetical protein HYH03_010513 [Edaphochlamys debaryana]|eukprot:KAG2491068.1 hypothetical protein HYH03_010513 [Edaphochlamys debaryana]